MIVVDEGDNYAWRSGGVENEPIFQLMEEYMTTGYPIVCLAYYPDCNLTSSGDWERFTPVMQNYNKTLEEWADESR